MRTVEAFLAILLLFSALTVATLITPASNRTDGDHSLATVGMQALVSMDSDGQLGKLIDSRDWSALREAFDATLLTGTAYNLTVYDGDMQVLNNVSISNGMLPSQSVIAVQYPCASPSLQVRLYLLRLQLAMAR
jgi:hypothetical protein